MKHPPAWLQDLYGQFARGKSPREVFRGALLAGVALSTVLVIGLTAFHAGAVPRGIEAAVHDVLAGRPWVRELVVIDGRRVYLHGEIEPGAGIEREISLIRTVPGVARVVNQLRETPRPEPFLHLSYRDESLSLEGRLNGDTLDRLADVVEAVYPGVPVSDRIAIDDRLGRPLWLDGLADGLSRLDALDEYELNGWRDVIELGGVAGSQAQRRRAGYAFAAPLQPSVRFVNRLRERGRAGFPELVVAADWRGVHLSGAAPSARIRDTLVGSIAYTLGATPPRNGLEVDPSLDGAETLLRLGRFIESLGAVRNLRLESDGDGYVVWGAVDHPHELGRVLHRRNQLGLEDAVVNRIQVARAAREATLSVFHDGHQTILSGILPSLKSKQQLLQAVEHNFGIDGVVDLITIQPDVAHSAWLDHWEALLGAVSGSVLGVTVDGDALLVTGNVASADELARLDTRLAQLFPGNRILNWATAEH